MNLNKDHFGIRILQIGPVEPKLWKIREMAVVWNQKTAVLYNTVDFRKSTGLYNTSVFWFLTIAISRKICGIVTQIWGIVQYRRFLVLTLAIWQNFEQYWIFPFRILLLWFSGI